MVLARKNLETCYFGFSKKNAAKKIGGYESVTATIAIFSSWKCQPLFSMHCPACNVVSKFWYTAGCGPHVAQITGKLWQWLSGSTPRPKRAANGLLAVPWCRELKNAVPDQQLVQGLFRNTFWANLGQFGCSGSLLGVFLCVPEQFHRCKANFAYHTGVCVCVCVCVCAVCLCV